MPAGVQDKTKDPHAYTVDGKTTVTPTLKWTIIKQNE